tara:strand:+ start:1150 stop:1362 length:213 start_codon:yes stop_codon:yes gene_type:complete
MEENAIKNYTKKYMEKPLVGSRRVFGLTASLPLRVPRGVTRLIIGRELALLAMNIPMCFRIACEEGVRRC